MNTKAQIVVSLESLYYTQVLLWDFCKFFPQNTINKISTNSKLENFCEYIKIGIKVFKI